jgi:hypothetical protein
VCVYLCGYVSTCCRIMGCEVKGGRQMRNRDYEVRQFLEEEACFM